MLKIVMQGFLIIGINTILNASEANPKGTINVTEAVKDFIVKNPGKKIPMPPRELSIAGFLADAAYLVNNERVDPLPDDKSPKIPYNASRPEGGYRYGFRVKVLIDVRDNNVGVYRGPYQRKGYRGANILFIYNPIRSTLEVKKVSPTTVTSSHVSSESYYNWEVPEFPYIPDPVPAFNYDFPNGLRLQAHKTGNATFDWSATGNTTIVSSSSSSTTSSSSSSSSSPAPSSSSTSTSSTSAPSTSSSSSTTNTSSSSSTRNPMDEPD